MDEAKGTGERAVAPVTGVSHLQLRVRDVARSADWYSTVLGLVPFASGDGYAALRHPPSGVVVVLSTGGSGPAEGSTLDHLAFAVPDGDALAAWADTLAAAGIDHPGVVLELGKPSLQLLDPDGNAVELVAPPAR